MTSTCTVQQQLFVSNINVFNSKTFKDLLYQIPKLSRTYSIFKDFQGPVASLPMLDGTNDTLHFAY